MSVTSVGKKRSLREYCILLLKACCMGAADIVPGVSGGTMAFILGIYEELIDSVRVLGHKKFWGHVVRFQIRSAILTLNWKFLCVVALGNIVVALSVAKVLEHLFETQPIAIWSFFFGLIVASIHIVTQKVQRWTVKRIAALAVGILFVYFFVGLVPFGIGHDPITLFVSGILSGSAGILPGLSGSFVLLLLGQYEFLLQSINAFNLVPFFIIGCGALTGIVGLTQILSWLLRRYHDITAAFLIGFMIGSLRKIWPWKATDTITNVLPHSAEELLVGVVACFLGTTIVLSLEYWAKSHRRP